MKHIAILRQPFFNMVLNCEKTIESRWSMNKIAPYKKVSIWDEILLKLTEQPVTAIVKVKDVKYYEFTPIIVEQMREFEKQITNRKKKQKDFEM